MENLHWSHEDGIAVITFKRPPANALSTGLLKELSAALDEIESNRQIRVVVIHGEGRFFSAGADIKEFTSVSSSGELSTSGQDLMERIEKFPKPIIAAIHGAALGGGLELAMACHIRLVSETAKLGLPELQLGIIPGFAGTQRLPRYVGVAKAAEMMLTSEPITGLEAFQFGLANHAYPEEEVLNQALKLARKIAKKSPGSIKAVIELLNYTKTKEFYEGTKREAELFAELFVTNDAKEGIQAFIEKREPNFKGD
ncbi:enoyl-CoA hydratase [Neobacillus thermocopriae]|uniref:Enoyl-CoA hydratase n=1 Tax=Neobacillus thermocopriae TaxID=1215031 RepID=A0A6B3TP54_9BACI|nr:enoyl-CoA hydratase [Neobacillus thermocopriae]MED3622681.1 enoyl-CoA hydratase [Neobacillus thermocopriae]MED3714117.1 enoyl-CoA hydratase [Neobacillus thermocopriae]NEX78402.1 enoyl-CoA hydratase [Neobacillus thermocopriae]